jgi:hypothetical protein
MVNKNNGWLIIELKTLPFTSFLFFGEGLDEKMEG